MLLAIKNALSFLHLAGTAGFFISCLLARINAKPLYDIRITAKKHTRAYAD
jgi:hypothetical protein